MRKKLIVNLCAIALFSLALCGCSQNKKENYNKWENHVTCTSTTSKSYKATFIFELGFNKEGTKLEKADYIIKWNENDLKMEKDEITKSLKEQCDKYLKDESGAVSECSYKYEKPYYVQTITIADKGFKFMIGSNFNSKQAIVEELESGEWDGGFKGTFVCE